MHKDGYYSSGEFAKKSNVSVRTIRYYDQQNILKPSLLTDEGVRFYTDSDFTRLQQILLLKYLGFTLDDYKEYTESRGWVFENPLEYMPGSHIYNMDEFEQFLLDVKNGKDSYIEERAKVRVQTHNVCENYCQRVLDYLKL